MTTSICGLNRSEIGGYFDQRLTPSPNCCRGAVFATVLHNQQRAPLQVAFAGLGFCPEQGACVADKATPPVTLRSCVAKNVWAFTRGVLTRSPLGIFE